MCLYLWYLSILLHSWRNYSYPGPTHTLRVLPVFSMCSLPLPSWRRLGACRRHLRSPAMSASHSKHHCLAREAFQALRTSTWHQGWCACDVTQWRSDATRVICHVAWVCVRHVINPSTALSEFLIGSDDAWDWRVRRGPVTGRHAGVEAFHHPDQFCVYKH